MGIYGAGLLRETMEIWQCARRMQVAALGEHAVSALCGVEAVVMFPSGAEPPTACLVGHSPRGLAHVKNHAGMWCMELRRAAEGMLLLFQLDARRAGGCAFRRTRGST